MNSTRKGLCPSLRFPEFRDSGDWEEKTIDSIFDLQDGFSFSSNDFISNTSIADSMQVIRITDINNKNYNSDKVFISKEYFDTKELSKYCVDEGDLLLSLTGAAGFNFFIWNSVMAVLNQRTLKIIPKDKANNMLKILLEPLLSEKININGTGQNNNLSKEILKKTFITIPLDLAEQQKIADCLSSLDELINGEIKKLEAYKLHKKGMMQKLFPAEGRSVPEYRFPEFRDSGDWGIYSLSDICENLDAKRIPITEMERKKGLTPYYGASGIVDHVDGFIFNKDLLCVSEDGANLIARTYPIAFSISGKTWVNNHAHVLRFECDFTQTLVESYLNSINLSHFLTGMAQPKLNRAKLDIIPIPLPDENEQKKISGIISSLDALITAQAKKIESLKVHKKGLMQGLFPSLEDGE